jgi:plasmid stabilization system protein ParE
VSLLVRPDAAADIEEAYLWYASQRRGLGNEFLDAVMVVFEGLLDNPLQHRVVHRDTRRANLRRFPHGVFYRIIDADVVVMACFHASRDPHRWRRRA